MSLLKHRETDADKIIEERNHEKVSPETAFFLKSAANLDLDFEIEDGGVDMCASLERKYKEKELLGEARGEARGEAKGEKKAKRQMILNLLKNGVDESIIADSAEVTAEYVVQIKNGEVKII